MLDIRGDYMEFSPLVTGEPVNEDIKRISGILGKYDVIRFCKTKKICQSPSTEIWVIMQPPDRASTRFQIGEAE
jgi:hypothetical protein